MKPAVFEKLFSADTMRTFSKLHSTLSSKMAKDQLMAPAPGGLMNQKIHDDEYGFDVWEKDIGSR